MPQWPLITLGFVLGMMTSAAIRSRDAKPSTPVDKWADVYRTCVGSYPTDQQRAACIAAADRVLACTAQKEEK